MRVIWSIITFPFRLIGLIVALLGRAVGLTLGFILMVIGVAFCAGMILILGLPVFVVGFLVTLKALE